MADIRVAVIGIGHLGSIHARVYSQLNGVKLAGVCDTDVSRARKIAREFRTEHFTDYRPLIGKIDAASISVPTNLHHEISKYFLENGVNLLIEKPITKTVAEADELLSIAKAKGLILQVGHVERFNSAFLAAEKTIKNPLFIECHRLGPYKQRSTDIGVVLDLMIHDIDIILGLVKDEIKEIDAIGAAVLSDYEDIANVRLKFKNNVICNLTASRITNKTMRKIRIFQKNAYISLDYHKPSCLVYTMSGKKINCQRVRVRKEEPLKLELEAFIDCVRTKEKPLVSGIEGREALATAITIQEQIKNLNYSYR
ncbi:MAG: Gfo/Idh/MocA family oxidoreductase [Candidatus Omnitrophica bacterium]|nr:Gfo/Idh/MocA family oxidoreductase [Candidatus Omnitrophota bacterium]